MGLNLGHFSRAMTSLAASSDSYGSEDCRDVGQLKARWIDGFQTYLKTLDLTNWRALATNSSTGKVKK